MGNPYEQGQEAFLKGLTAGSNPHKEQAEKQRAWQEGWEDAKIEADLRRRDICADRREPAG
jgi:hypothetical protein